MSRLVRLTLKDSDNFFAEMLAKDLALQARGRGTTRVGARLAAAFARRLGQPGPAGGRLRALARGPGLALPRGPAAHGDAAARRGRTPCSSSLPIAGRDGTLADRMRSGPARLALPREDRARSPT